MTDRNYGWLNMQRDSRIRRAAMTALVIVATLPIASTPALAGHNLCHGLTGWVPWYAVPGSWLLPHPCDGLPSPPTPPQPPSLPPDPPAVPPLPPPLISDNDNFADAAVVATLPYEARQTGIATFEVGEPRCPIGSGQSEQTIWYRYNGGETTTFRINAGNGVMVNVYTGDRIDALTWIGGTSHRWAQSIQFTAQASTTYNIQLCAWTETVLLDWPMSADFFVPGPDDPRADSRF